MKNISTIIIREWKRILTIPNFYVVLLVIPVLLFFFYGFIYQKHSDMNLPIAVFDEDQSKVSRTLTDMVQHQKNVHIQYYVSSEAEVEKLMKENKIFGAIYFPKNLEFNIKKNHQTSITLFTNGAYIVPAKLIYKAAAKVIIKGGLGVVLQKSKKLGMPTQQANALIQPIKLNTTILYNPDFDYQLYLTPGLITVGLQMALIVASVLILNIEFYQKTQDELLKISTSSSQIVVGKFLAHLCVSWILFILVAFVILPYFDLDKPIVAFNFFILYTLLSSACIGIGMMLSALFNKLLLVIDIALFFTSPAFVFSGFTFPRWAMPWYDQFYADIMPYTHFLDGFIKVYYMQLPLVYSKVEMIKLLLFIVITLSIAIVAGQIRIKNYLKQKASA